MTEPKNKTECTCECHLGFPWQEINGECIHCKPTQPQQEEWEEKLKKIFKINPEQEWNVVSPEYVKTLELIREILSQRTQSLLQGLEGLPGYHASGIAGRDFVNKWDVKALIEKGGKC